MTQNLTAEKMDEFSQAETAAEKKPKSGAFLVGVTEQGELPQDAREHLDELRELVSTLGFPVAGEMMTVIRVPNVKFYLGSGKAEEVCNAAKQAGAELIVFDTELGPSQQRNLERLARTNVVDRQEIILDIFAERAQTREAVLQVELARNKYFLPRLTRAWSHLSRQRGGAKGTRGEGEKQIEYDRRRDYGNYSNSHVYAKALLLKVLHGSACRIQPVCAAAGKHYCLNPFYGIVSP